MEVQPDFKELLELFNARRVEYMIVGGYALAFHGAPRFTGDMDLYVRPTPENSHRVLDALAAFGFGGLDLSASDLDSPGKVVQLGFPPVRLDLMTSISGLSWEDACGGRVIGTYGELRVPYIGRRELVANKKAVGRKKDIADIEAIGEEDK